MFTGVCIGVSLRTTASSESDAVLVSASQEDNCDLDSSVDYSTVSTNFRQRGPPPTNVTPRLLAPQEKGVGVFVYLV